MKHKCLVYYSMITFNRYDDERMKEMKLFNKKERIVRVTFFLSTNCFSTNLASQAGYHMLLCSILHLMDDHCIPTLSTSSSSGL